MLTKSNNLVLENKQQTFVDLVIFSFLYNQESVQGVLFWKLKRCSMPFLCLWLSVGAICSVQLVAAFTKIKPGSQIAKQLCPAWLHSVSELIATACDLLHNERFIYIGRPPLRGDKRYPRGEVQCVQQWDSSVSSLRARHTNCSVVSCKNHHQCLYSVPATEQQKRQWLRFIF